MKVTRAVPAVGAAILSAYGVVWVLENTEPPPDQRERRDDDRTVVAELHTSSEATFVVVMRSGWRGTIAEVSRSISRFDQVTEVVAAGEPVEVVVIGEQDAPDGRQQVRCRITVNGRELDARNIVVRTGEKKTIKCQGSD